MSFTLTAACQEAAKLNPASPTGQDLHAELTDLLDRARDVWTKIDDADAEYDQCVEAYLARNDFDRETAQ